MRAALVALIVALTSMVAAAFIVLIQVAGPLSLAVLVAVGSALVVVSALVVNRVAGRLVRSIDELTAAATALGAGDLDVRITSTGQYELLELSVAFNVMADRTRQHIQSERELAADLSHRLRTPLTALRLGIAALPQGSDGQQVAEVASWLEQEVDAVIDSARRGDLARDRTDCDAALVLRERMDFWSTLAEDEGREAYYIGPARGVRVPLPRGDLGATIDVLLGNVFRHTPQGVAFRLVLTCPSAEAMVTVEDAGPGFPPFPPAPMSYSTGGLPVQAGSTRLGLDIVRRTTKGVGGSVEAGRSSLGGAMVTLHIPLVGSSAQRRRGRDRRFARLGGWNPTRRDQG